MSEHMSNPHERFDVPPQFGRPDVVFLPSNGYTCVGVILALGFALIGLLPLIVDGNVSTTVFITLPSICLAYYVWRKRKWRFLICLNGVIQLWAGGSESLLWSEVTEVVATRNSSMEGTLLELTLYGATEKITVGGFVNCPNWREIMEVILETARQRGVAIRIQISKGKG